MSLRERMSQHNECDDDIKMTNTCLLPFGRSEGMVYEPRKRERELDAWARMHQDVIYFIAISLVIKYDRLGSNIPMLLRWHWRY